MAAASTQNGAPHRCRAGANRAPEHSPGIAEPRLGDLAKPGLRGAGDAAALAPRSAMPARLVPLAVGRTAVAVSGLADSGVVHRLTRGRLWIGALTTLLVGIVSLNVLALSLNASSSKVGRQADALNREISALRAEIATNGASNQRIQAVAAKLGLIVPEPGAVGYLRPSRDDAAVAAKRLASGELTAQASYEVPLRAGDRADDDPDLTSGDRRGHGHASRPRRRPPPTPPPRRRPRRRPRRPAGSRRARSGRRRGGVAAP